LPSAAGGGKLGPGTPAESSQQVRKSRYSTGNCG
jgi:hypothetical protein